MGKFSWTLQYYKKAMKLSVPIFQSLMLVLLVVTISGLKKHSKHKPLDWRSVGHMPLLEQGPLPEAMDKAVNSRPKTKTYLIETVDDDVNSVEGLNPRQIGGVEGGGDYCMPFSMWCGR